MLDRIGQLPGVAQFCDRAVQLLAEGGRLLCVLEMIRLVDLVDVRQRRGLHLRPVG
jgi:tRNA1(Val) A37 N6-methylase TrmN6